MGNAIAIIDQLSTEEIEARIGELHREDRALRVLLRAARAKEQRTAPPSAATPRPREEVPCHA